MAGKKTLLVEGPDDMHVFKHVCGNRGGLWLDEFVPYDGVENLLDGFPTRMKAVQEGDVIGVVVDADTNIASRWQAVRDRLVGLGYRGVPSTPAPEGTIVDPPSGMLLPRAGIWIMPDNQNSGILEDFLRPLVPPGSHLFDHVKASVGAIPVGDRLFSELAKPKVLVHTWLAWQENPGYPLGKAISARYLDVNLPQVDVLVAWLNRLFFQ